MDDYNIGRSDEITHYEKEKTLAYAKFLSQKDCSKLPLPECYWPTGLRNAMSEAREAEAGLRRRLDKKDPYKIQR